MIKQSSGREEAPIACDVDGIERATLAAVSPQTVEELGGWLLAFDKGTVNRAKSAAPLQHAAGDLAVLEQIEGRYAEHGLQPLFRLADAACFNEVRQALAQRGYRAGRPTRVQIAPVQAMRSASAQPTAELATTPDAAWAALFLGDGVDPTDGASRVAALSGAPDALYASVREGNQTVAAGAAVFSHGWASVHGMRTATPWRGRGMAGRILAALAGAAAARGLDRCFLQVEVGNTAAQSLYHRWGFQTAWTYEYWRRE